jgi:hypothetical protein
MESISQFSPSSTPDRRKLVSIQRKFLWGSNGVRVKTCWVKWDDVCRPKNVGGLGIRDLRLVNLSLLAKWRWKLLFLDDEVWKEVVISRYGRDVVGKKSLGEHDITRLTSPWWRDVCLLEGPTHWFSTAVGGRWGVVIQRSFGKINGQAHKLYDKDSPFFSPSLLKNLR